MKRHIWNFGLGTLIVAGMFLSGIQVTKAFTTFPNNPKWPNADPHYIIDSDYTNSGPGWNQMVQNAVASWNSIGNSSLRFKSVGGSGDNHIKTENLGCTSPPNPPVVAYTAMNFNSNMTQITKFTVKINTWCGYSFYDGTQAPSIPINYYDLRSIVQHELGHGMGLCHTSVGGAIMGGISKGQVLQKKLDDSRGDRFLYQAGYGGPGPSGNDC